MSLLFLTWKCHFPMLVNQNAKEAKPIILFIKRNISGWVLFGVDFNFFLKFCWLSIIRMFFFLLWPADN